MTEANVSPKVAGRSPGKSRGLSVVWVVPILAVLFAGVVVTKSVLDRGPAVEVRFSTAEGLVAGETSVKRLSVQIGVVEKVVLDGDAGAVVATLRLDPGARNLLRVDSQFWVVRPRVGAGGVSGLSTLLSGGYVEVSPGTGAAGADEFIGLETPPRISQSALGTHLELSSPTSGSIGVGSPILFHGHRVGEVEEVDLSVDDQAMHVRIFIYKPYDGLVTEGVRFWNVSGITVKAGTEGLKLQTGSLESLIVGGIAFDLPSGGPPGEPVSNGHAFELYADQEAAEERAFEHSFEYLLMFDSSVRGLAVGAPVEYRGVAIGSVVAISFGLVPRERRWSPTGHALIPVLVRLEPGRVEEDEAAAIDRLRSLLEEATSHGLRAQLSPGSLISGSLFVEFEFHDEAAPASVVRIGDFESFPTAKGGLELLQEQLGGILEKVADLPIERMLDTADRAVGVLTKVGNNTDGAVTELRALLGNDDLSKLPAHANLALQDLSTVLAGLKPSADAYVESLEVIRAARNTLAGLSPESPAYAEIMEAIRSARGTLEGFSPNSSVYSELVRVLSTVQLSVRDASELFRSLKERPSALLFSKGRGPDPVPGSSR